MNSGISGAQNTEAESRGSSGIRGPEYRSRKPGQFWYPRPRIQEQKAGAVLVSKGQNTEAESRGGSGIQRPES